VLNFGHRFWWVVRLTTRPLWTPVKEPVVSIGKEAVWAKKTWTMRNSAVYIRGGVRSTRGLGPTVTARGQSIGISIAMLPQTFRGRHGGDYGTKDIQLLHYVIWPWRRIFLNRACISISNFPENIAWQTDKDDLRPEARGPLKSGAWGGRPTCHPQTPPLVYIPVGIKTRFLGGPPRIWSPWWLSCVNCCGAAKGLDRMGH